MLFKTLYLKRSLFITGELLYQLSYASKLNLGGTDGT